MKTTTTTTSRLSESHEFACGDDIERRRSTKRRRASHPGEGREILLTMRSLRRHRVGDGPRHRLLSITERRTRRTARCTSRSRSHRGERLPGVRPNHHHQHRARNHIGKVVVTEARNRRRGRREDSQVHHALDRVDDGTQLPLETIVEATVSKSQRGIFRDNPVRHVLGQVEEEEAQSRTATMPGPTACLGPLANHQARAAGIARRQRRTNIGDATPRVAVASPGGTKRANIPPTSNQQCPPRHGTRNQA